FFLKLSDTDKAEYSFIVDNFAVITRQVLEPIEENFYNVVNKIKSYNSGNNDYSSSTLKLYLRIMLIFGSLLVGYVYAVGTESVIFVFTHKWATESTIRILRVYSIYIAIISFNGIMEAHSNA